MTRKFLNLHNKVTDRKILIPVDLITEVNQQGTGSIITAGSSTYVVSNAIENIYDMLSIK